MTPTYTAAEVVELMATIDDDGMQILCNLIAEEHDCYTKAEHFWFMNTLTGIYYHRTNKL